MKLYLGPLSEDHEQPDSYEFSQDGDLAWLGLLAGALSAAIVIGGTYWLISWAIG